jgi:hypothetical protein
VEAAFINAATSGAEKMYGLIVCPGLGNKHESGTKQSGTLRRRYRQNFRMISMRDQRVRAVSADMLWHHEAKISAVRS